MINVLLNLFQLKINYIKKNFLQKKLLLKFHSHRHRFVIVQKKLNTTRIVQHADKQESMLVYLIENKYKNTKFFKF